MNKIFIMFFIILSIYGSIGQAFSADYFHVISRKEWGTNENFKYLGSVYWNDIFKKNAQNKKYNNTRWNTYSPEKKKILTQKQQEKSKKRRKMNRYLSRFFGKYIKTVYLQRDEGKHSLAWNISKSDRVKNIVIHHTHSEYKDSFSGIKNIYKYHALHNQWGDIGYHYVIGYNGEIFEGRTGGDYVVGAHDTWNNYSTVGISIMGNYDKRKVSDEQYQSLKKLVSHLTKKYGINLNNKIPYHKECYGEKCLNGLETHYYHPIVGHKDGKATSCPGKHVYEDTIPKLLRELKGETKEYTEITYTQMLINKKTYKKELDTMDWSKIRNRYIEFPQSKKERFNAGIKHVLQQELHLKQKMLFTRVLEEIQKTEHKKK